MVEIIFEVVFQEYKASKAEMEAFSNIRMTGIRQPKREKHFTAIKNRYQHSSNNELVDSFYKDFRNNTNECCDEESEIDSSSGSDKKESSDPEELLCVPDDAAKTVAVTGRRIVNISYFLKQLKNLQHEVSEKIEGLQSIFTFKCDINPDGIPIISSTVDGAWSKRSYRTNYSALSGVVSILLVR
ncbi:hypothetical protein RN001_001505 [Aquatica leii]|uniref:Uncharacterized protein n=1 Tax=Aquatica leii TaxID=1421715 RepID=A0AAN7PG14_9COLE|nr:hypothetical protein RN001_001505 [Aquatica leii]